MTERPLRLTATLVEAVQAIEASRRRLAVVVDDDDRVVGTLTDGDVRRALLAGGGLDMPVGIAMHREPLTATDGSPDGYLLDLLRSKNVVALPLVDNCGRFLRLVHLTDLGAIEGACGPGGDGFAFAVIMAGGEGVRLRPLTQSVPKPMVDVGGVPMLERQVRRLALAGIKRVFLAVNYLGEIIERHFEDGRSFGVRIEYLREREKLGTAGALSLLPERPEGPILVMNGDIVTTSDFGSLLAFHRSYEAHITVAAVDYRVNIPYGVLRSEGPLVTELTEKPSQRFLCNAGIYAIAPQCLGLIEAGRACDITDLIDTCLKLRHPVAVFPVHEYWSDIGTPDDLEKARAFFASREQA